MFQEYVFLKSYWKSQEDTEVDETDVLELTGNMVKELCSLKEIGCHTTCVVSSHYSIDDDDEDREIDE